MLLTRQYNATNAIFIYMFVITKRETGEAMDLQNLVRIVKLGSGRRKITFTFLNL